MDAKQQLQKALKLHQAGQTGDAAMIYGEIIRANPGNVDALNLLASILTDAGNLDSALNLCRQATTIAPDFFAPWVTMGNTLQAMGRLEEAADAFRRSCSLNTESPHAFTNLGSVLNALKRFEEARDACKTALTLDPTMAAAYNNLGHAHLGLGEEPEAETAFARAVELVPGFSDALYNLGTTLSRMGRADEAIPHLEAALRLTPHQVNKTYNLALAYAQAGRYETAEATYRACLNLDPGHEDSLNNLAATLKDLGRPGEAEDYLRQALAANPDDAQLHWNLSLVLLQTGKFEEGWREYEWRWESPGFTTQKRDFNKPAWDGGEAPGATLLLHAEQGFGDAILAARYVPPAAKGCNRIVVECRPGLERLLGTLDGAAEIVTMGDDLPPFDLQLPMMSLPRAFGTTLKTVPAEIPYLTVPDGAEADSRIAEADGIRVGIVWAGSATLKKDVERSLDPKLFRMLAGVEGVTLFSLQVGGPTQGFEALADLGNAVDLAPGITDFADTAAAVAALDLVVSVDTAVAHLAGALGKPVWTLHAVNASHQWLMEREDSPWYPTMRLFRQPDRGEWQPVMAQVTEALKAMAAKKRP